MAGELPDDLSLQRMFEEVEAEGWSKDYSMDVDSDSDSDSLRQKMKAFLEKRARNDSAFNNVNDTGSCSYMAIKRFNEKLLETPSLNGGVKTTAPKFGSFRPGDCRIKKLQNGMFPIKKEMSPLALIR
jgi:hypothetical protein